jgi:hypothetical protein
VRFVGGDFRAGGLDADSEDDEEVAARHTLERGMTWARRAFDFILHATLVSFLVKDYPLDLAVFSGHASHLVLVGCRPSSLQVGDVPSRCANSRGANSAGDAARRGPVAAAMASETSARASLEAACQSAEDRAISTETTAATAVTERDSLASRLALAEAKIERLRAAAASAEEAAERAKTVAATEETTARDATQTAAREKAALEAKVLELESDLRTATTDLATTSR